MATAHHPAHLRLHFSLGPRRNSCVLFHLSLGPRRYTCVLLLMRPTAKAISVSIYVHCACVATLLGPRRYTCVLFLVLLTAKATSTLLPVTVPASRMPPQGAKMSRRLQDRYPISLSHGYMQAPPIFKALHSTFPQGAQLRRLPCSTGGDSCANGAILSVAACRTRGPSTITRKLGTACRARGSQTSMRIILHPVAS